jgi:hypothetical protein
VQLYPRLLRLDALHGVVPVRVSLAWGRNLLEQAAPRFA